MTDFSHSLEIAKKSGSNFTASFFFLPKDQRMAMMTIYAFSRLVDDAVDRAENLDAARDAISGWRLQLKSCYSNNGEGGVHPVIRELRETIRRFEIPDTYFLDLLEGVSTDLDKKRYATFDELQLYCDRVAGTIGLLCNQIFGRHDETGYSYARILGTAFQLTNIIRDVGSDAARGRIYLPQEDLERFGYSEFDLLNKKGNDAFTRLMEFEADRARRFFEKADRILPPGKRRRFIAAEVMYGVYRGLLEKMERQRFPVFEKKVGVSSLHKFCILTKAYLFSKVVKYMPVFNQRGLSDET